MTNAHGPRLLPLGWRCEALGLAFAFGNETGSTAFNTNFGPSNPATASDAAFASAASATIFGANSTPNLVNVMTGFVANWHDFFTSHGIPGTASANSAQIDLAARATAGETWWALRLPITSVHGRNKAPTFCWLPLKTLPFMLRR